MRLRGIAVLILFAAVINKTNTPTYAMTSDSSASASIECAYLTTAGGILDDGYIWTIPYEVDSFSKISIETGKKVDITKYSSSDELKKLSGYRCGALYENAEGEKFIYLVPFDVTKPLARINLENMNIDYPIRNIGYYYSSCQLTSENGIDYLWLFPGKTKPLGAPTVTEIVKINLTDNKKETSISTIIDNKYYAFSDTLLVDGSLWLLPCEEGQPLVKLDTKSEIESLDDENVKKIYSGSDMNFSKIATGVFDGVSIWFVCEDISFMFNDSSLVRCDINGEFIESIGLTKDQYLKAVANGEYIYLFAGAEGMQPQNVKINTITGATEFFISADKKGFVPAEAILTDGLIYVLPLTKDGRKMPSVKILSAPEINVTACTDKKTYRDYGDMSKGCEIKLDFDTPDGFKPISVLWFASDKPHIGGDTVEVFNEDYSNAKESDKKYIDLKGNDEITVLADKNGEYRFMAEFISEDEKNSLYSFGSAKIENIYERLPITLTRYDIEDWSDNSVLEHITHKKDFGAAFSFDGKEFIKTDAPMDMVPLREVFARDVLWQLESPLYYTINLRDGNINPDDYFAEFDTSYRMVKTEALIESEEIEKEMSNTSDVAYGKNHVSYGDSGKGALLVSATSEEDTEPAQEKSASNIRDVSVNYDIGADIEHSISGDDTEDVEAADQSEEETIFTNDVLDDFIQ